MSGTDVSTLLEVQKNYITNLESNSLNPTKNAISLNAINDSLKNISSSLANNSTAYILTGQNTVNEIVTREQDRLTKKEHSIELAESGKNRIIQLNTNYKKRIEAYNSIIFTLIVSMILYIVLFIVKRAKILPERIVSLLFIVIIAGAIIYCGKKYITILFRDNVYFDELNGNSIFFKTPESILKDISNNKITASSSGISITGMNINTDFCPTPESYCADGTVWDSDKSKCVIGTETFVSSYSPSEFSAYSKKI
jgi:hypothetical protein